MSRNSYLAIIADAEAIDAERLAACATYEHKLLPVFQTAGLTVLVGADTPHRLFKDTGIVVGHLHRSETDATRRAETDLSDVAAFISEFWGDYVAFSCNPGRSGYSVIRAPAGGLPAFRATIGETTLIASDPELLLVLAKAAPRIDWRFVAHHLAFPHLRCAATGLAGIDELFAGDCVVFGDVVRREPLWTPWHFASSDRQFVDPDTARLALRAAVSKSVAALVRPFRSVLLELSGGLDSSVLAAALAAARAPTVAVNLVTPGSEGDERIYARSSAAAAGLRLTERHVDADVDLTRPVRGRFARPGLPQILAPADRLLAATARVTGTEAFVSGAGGDCVFCAPGSAAPAADALRLFGPGRRFLRAVRQIAEIHDTNLWTAGAMAWRQAHRPPIHRSWPRTDAFLNRDMIPDKPDFHPWLIEPDGALPGRRSHIRAVVAAFAHLDGYGRHGIAPSLYPLLSQPVMEVCLRIPTWMWIEGGRDRAIARQAFADVLPDTVIARRSKGGMDAYCLRNFEANRTRLEPFLLDGHLAGAGLLDRHAVAAYLRQPVGPRDPRFYRLLPIVDAEAWARSWLDPVTTLPTGGP